VIWKVCAVLPLLLLCVLMSLRIADGSGKSDSKQASRIEDPATSSPDSRLPTPGKTVSVSPRKHKAASKTPDQIITDAGIPLPAFDMPPGGVVVTPSPKPTKHPTPKPPPSHSPSPTPTPGEARSQCLEQGISVLDVAALAQCIADLTNP
jgi:hypothetical protein